MEPTVAMTIRPYLPTDESSVVGVWFRAGKVTYTFLPSWQEFTLEEAHGVFQRIILPLCRLWVGSINGRVVSYMALRGSYLDRLYVDPPAQRQGYGSNLISHAKALCPDGLSLHTHQENHSAMQFYEHHGFTAVKFGFSPPPECAPDVEYHWP